MRQSFKEYVHAVGRRWWAMVGLGVGLLGIASGVSGNTILLPYWAWVIIGILPLMVAQFFAYHEVRKQLDDAGNEVASVISELESEFISVSSVSGQSISMARLFWAMGRDFLRGMNPDGIWSVIHEILESNGGESGKIQLELVYKLRLLKLISDEQRQRGDTGYIVTKTTSLGDSVIKELVKKWGDSPWPPSLPEQISNKEGLET